MIRKARGPKRGQAVAGTSRFEKIGERVLSEMDQIANGLETGRRQPSERPSDVATRPSPPDAWAAEDAASTPAGLVKVSLLKLMEAVRFDGTQDAATAIMSWIDQAHDRDIGPGQYLSGTIFQPLRFGDVLVASAGWWIVRRRRTEFVAYAPSAFRKLFKVVP